MSIHSVLARHGNDRTLLLKAIAASENELLKAEAVIEARQKAVQMAEDKVRRLKEALACLGE